MSINDGPPPFVKIGAAVFDRTLNERGDCKTVLVGGCLPLPHLHLTTTHGSDAADENFGYKVFFSKSGIVFLNRCQIYKGKKEL